MTAAAPLGQELVPPGCLRLQAPVWGIDPSTVRVAVAAILPFEGARLRFDILSLPRVEGPARFAPAYTHLLPWLTELAYARGWKPSHVFVEQPFAQGRNVHPSSQQMVGTVLAAVGNAVPGVKMRLLNPATWKKQAIGEGHGHADKDEIMEWARAQGYDRSFPDEADALGVATAGGVLLGG